MEGILMTNQVGDELKEPLRKLSDDDKRLLKTELNKIEKNISYKVMLPNAVFMVGNMHLAITKLKIPFLLRYRPISLYLTAAAVSYLSSKLITRTYAIMKIQPLLHSLIKKSETDNQSVSIHGGYEELRRRNRLNKYDFNEPPPLASDNYNEMGNEKPNEFCSKFNLGLEVDNNPKETSRMNTDPNQRKHSYDGYNYDSYGYMSGTPVPKISNENFRNDNRSEKPSYDSLTKNKYGDTDFS
uniref:OCIA domain-containing protein n=1 Tax=Strongyloides venezuelensis TaxID=75913 RepID=A0A0K0EYP1_STRVS